MRGGGGADEVWARGHIGKQRWGVKTAANRCKRRSLGGSVERKFHRCSEDGSGATSRHAGAALGSDSQHHGVLGAEDRQRSERC